MFKTTIKATKWTVFAIAAIYYLVEYVLRVSPAVMINEIMQDFHITPEEVGSLSAIYFYVYAAMQIPVGLIVDRCGVRTPLFWACLITTFGTVMFAHGEDVLTLQTGRALIGLGSAFGYLSCLKLVVVWFKPEKFTFMCALVNMLGMLGALSSQIMLSALMMYNSWHELMFYLAIACFFNAILIILCLKDHPDSIDPTLDKSLVKQPIKETLLKVISSKQIWCCGFFIGCIYCTFDMFADLWAIPFLEKTYEISKVKAASINSLIFLGAILGYPLLGAMAQKYKNKHKIIMVFSMVAILSCCGVIYIHPPKLAIIELAFFGLGFFSGITALGTALGKESVSICMSGAAIGVMNVMLVTIGGLSQPLFGYLLQMNSTVRIEDLHLLNQADFDRAFLLLPVLFFAAFIVLLTGIKQTHVQKV